MRKLLVTLLLVTAMVVSAVGMAQAESILFPYVVYNTSAGLDTMISVINVSAATQIHLRYIMKNATATNANVVACTEDNFYRATTQNDIVTFAVGGTSSLGSGNAMFNDATNYNSVGVGAPSFMPAFASPAVGYMMVTTAAGGADIAAADPATGVFATQLDGEASIYDITNGAMWGYYAISSLNNSNVNFQLPKRLDSTSTANIAAIANAPKISVYPPANFTGRLLITPLGAAMDATWTYSLTAGLYYANSTLGVFDRNEQTRSGGTTAAVTCVGRVDIANLAANSFNPTTGVLRTQGGWAYLGLVNTAAAGGTAVTQANVFDLKYGAITGSTIVNDAKLVLPAVGRY